MFKGKELGTLTTNRLLQLGEGVGFDANYRYSSIEFPEERKSARFSHSLDDWIPIDADLTIYTSTKLRVATAVCIEHEGIHFAMLTFMFVTQYLFCPPKKRQSNINWEILRI